MRARFINKIVNICESVILLGIVCKRTQWISEEQGTDNTWLWLGEKSSLFHSQGKLSSITSPLGKRQSYLSPLPDLSPSCTTTSTSLQLFFVSGSLTLILESPLNDPSGSSGNPGLVSSTQKSGLSSTHSPERRLRPPAPPPPLAHSCPPASCWQQTAPGTCLHLLEISVKVQHSPLPLSRTKLKSLSHFYLFLLSLKIHMQVFHLFYIILLSSGNENKHRNARKSQLPSLVGRKPLRWGSGVYIFKSITPNTGAL